MNTNSLFHRSQLTAYALLTVLLSTFLGPAQAQTESARERELFTVVEQPPEFVGGMKAYDSFMNAKVRQLKDTASHKLTGKVFVSFTVTDQGAIEEAMALNRQGSWEATEAVRLVQSMPAWKPGKQAGHAVNVKYNLPVNFSKP
jgi:protein TonB